MAKNRKSVKTAKTTGNSGILGAVVLGPTILALIALVIYLGWWGVSKLFYLIHGWVSGTVWVWLQANWFVLLIAWGIIILASIIFHYVVSAQKFKPMEVTEEDPNS